MAVRPIAPEEKEYAVKLLTQARRGQQIQVDDYDQARMNHPSTQQRRRYGL